MLLSDQGLQEVLTGPDPIFAPIAGVDQPFSANGAIQPSSVDLTVGEIFLPGTSTGNEGSIGHPVREHFLGAGETAVVQTAEEANFPSDLAAVAFPPDAVSKQGMLVTNPGHIDPGFRGRLKFTVINMGRAAYELKAGQKIATVLVFRLEQPSTQGWMERKGGAVGEGVTRGMLSRLSEDFVDFQRRAKQVARGQIYRFGTAGAFLTVLLTALTIAASLLPTYLVLTEKAKNARDRVRVVEQELAALTDRLERSGVVKRVQSRSGTVTRATARRQRMAPDA